MKDPLFSNLHFHFPITRKNGLKRKSLRIRKLILDLYGDFRGKLPHITRVGRVGIEPTWFAPGDFKSPASANSATAPDSAVILIVHSMQGRSRLDYLDLIKKGYLLVGVYIPE